MLCPKCKLNAPKGMKNCPVCGTAFSAVALISEEEQERIKKEQAKREHEEAERQRKEDEETIYVDPSRTFMHDSYSDDEGGFSIFDDLFGGGLFGNIFGGGFGGQRRGQTTTIRFGGGGGGIFDIFENLFGFGGGNNGGRYIDSNRARIEAPHEFYQLDEYDEQGFPIIRKDKLIDVTQKDLEKMQKDDKKNKHRKKDDGRH